MHQLTRKFCACAALFVFFSPLCGAVFATEQTRVVTSIRPLALLVNDLAGEPIAESVLDGAASPHHYTLTVSDIQRMRSANLFVWVGPDFDRYMEKGVKQFGDDKSLRLDQLKGLHWPSTESHHDSHGHHHDHHGRDMHLWLGFENVALLANAIAEQLRTLQPSRSTQIEQRLSGLLTQLNQLKADASRRFGGLRTKGFGAYHHGYSHFVESFGLNQSAFATLVPGERLSVKDLRALSAQLDGAACLISEVAEQEKALKLAQKLALPLVGVDILGQDVTEAASGSYAYIRYLQNIVQSFERCLTQN